MICVHGLWMPGEEMLFVKRQLQKKYGWDSELFSYPSVRGTLDDNAELLAEFVAQFPGRKVHLVGHSLGGVVALRLLSLCPETIDGRVVCMGSPLRGSRTAAMLHKSDWMSQLLGRTISDGVVGQAAAEWATEATGKCEVGSIAGTLSVGMGRLVANFDEPNDGTVAVDETRLPGLRDHICMPVSHSGMVLSADVVEQIVAFLKTGRFKQ